MLRASLLVAQAVLHVGGLLVLDVAEAVTWCGRLLLRGARWCGARAREWQPRLRARDGDPGSDAEERRP